MEADDSLPFSQESAAGPYRELGEFIPHPPILFL
jgi:hypothetical protein